MADGNPDLCFYGDDFTGSTDALDALARGGLPGVLFFDLPPRDVADRFPHAVAIGIAGTTRAMSPSQAFGALKPALTRLAELRPRLLHYKVCSTFDSSPDVGSIGPAIDIGRGLLADAAIPVLIGVPALRRYVVFGNLFAAAGADDNAYRLDRHPVMSVHPVTPMRESELARHLRGQTALPSTLFDVRRLSDNGSVSALLSTFSSAEGLIIVDTLFDAHLATVGTALREFSKNSPRFVVGSSAVEYSWSLSNTTGVQNWRAPPRPRATRAVLVVSGSCSAVTAAQITTAVQAGFAEIAVPPAAIMAGAHSEAWSTVQQRVLRALGAGQSVVVHTACGPGDPRIAQLSQLVQSSAEASSVRSQRLNELVGAFLGHSLRDAMTRDKELRGVVSGGDTSGFTMRTLGDVALEVAALITPGAPLCRVLDLAGGFTNREIALKGGQMGPSNYFLLARGGELEG